jgi:sortase A
MTAVESEQQAGSPGQAPAGAGPGESGQTPESAAQAAPPEAASAAEPGDGIIQGFGVAVTLLALLILGFAGYLYFLSGVQEARAQSGMFVTLQYELGQATAPLGSPKPGTPVALLNIPAIGIHDEVVVEGTSPENLTLGPGHLRDTPLPGQYGISVLYGRRATFGAPFARVPQIRPGDRIHVTTGQGTATYIVKIVGDSRNRIMIDPAANQLDLLTADSALIPTHYVEVEANLITAPQQNPGGRPAVTPAELALGNDPTALILTMAWGLALVIVAAAGTVAATRWSRWPAYLVALPLALAIVWNLYQSLAALLPNLY